MDEIGLRYFIAVAENESVSRAAEKLNISQPAVSMMIRKMEDELDAKLHPKLLQYIVQLFHNPQLNKKGAQLVFTSHDLATMKNTVFRRDEIWFACEDANHISHIYSLYDIRRENNIRVNNTASYDKQYLEGRYGADPYLQNMIGEIWNESETTQEN